jgi:hypothetical protein
MNDNKSVESFVLGLIVAAIFFLLWKKHLAGGNGSAARGGAGKASCNCGKSPCESIGGSTSPTSIGGQSYEGGVPYPGSSVSSFLLKE